MHLRMKICSKSKHHGELDSHEEETILNRHLMFWGDSQNLDAPGNENVNNCDLLYGETQHSIYVPSQSLAVILDSELNSLSKEDY